ncbi:MAG: pyridoxal phosphate-dependent aminotransferase [Marinilabiliaceae bacterium]|nr:pyridoxal phosphate-dependent aminotransferase [Marinilabiliaceae bacterium]
MNTVSYRIQKLAQSETLAMAQRSRELQAKGIDVINLSIGEPDFNTPDHIKQAAKQAIDDNFSHYTPVPGLPALRQAIVDKLKRENGLTYTIDQVVASTGGKQAIANVLYALINPGDEVVLPAPYWVSYIEMVRLAEGVCIEVKAGIEQDYKITPAQLEQAITPRTRAFLFSSPSNPTGSVYSRQELEALAVVFRKHPHVIIISDEIYEHINYDGTHCSFANIDDLKERVVIVNGLSKGYAMTGWRLGYIAAPQWLAAACIKLQGQYTSATCSVTQMAGVAALNGGIEPSRQMVQAFLRRRNLVVDLASQIPGMKVNHPQGAFYLFPDVSSLFGKKFGDRVIANAQDLTMYFLDEAHVATVAGNAFGSPECIRFSYATDDVKLTEAMRRLKVAVEQLT